MTIQWLSIAELPDHLKDGREVLLWDGDNADVGTWDLEQRWRDEDGWVDTSESRPISDVTFFSEINPPADPQS